jgi:hypothetical protein
MDSKKIYQTESEPENQTENEEENQNNENKNEEEQTKNIFERDNYKITLEKEYDCIKMECYIKSMDKCFSNIFYLTDNSPLGIFNYIG